MNKECKAIVFDMDGIIFDSERLIIECWKVVADKYGIHDIEDICNKCLGVNSVETKEIFLSYYGQDFPYDEYKAEMSALFHTRYGEGRLPMKKGIKELLEFLKENDIRIALASSTREAVVKQELRDAGLLDYFDAVICGDMVKRSKPAPDIFLKAAECLQIAPERCYVIEDSYNGIKAAYSANMRPLMVPDMLPPNKEMEDLSEYILPSLIEVKEYLMAHFFNLC
mgnify:CR=1 FL=1